MRNAQEFFEMYDSVCFHKDPKNESPLMNKKELDDYQEFESYKDMHEAEQYAESAWLRHAENQVDYEFEQWENSRVLY
jgi:hypothetical protein